MVKQLVTSYDILKLFRDLPKSENICKIELTAEKDKPAILIVSYLLEEKDFTGVTTWTKTFSLVED